MQKDSTWRRPKQTIGSITITILENLFAAAEMVGEYNIRRFQAHETIRRIEHLSCKKNSSRWINDLRTRGYIKIDRSKNEIVSIVFTNKAKMKIVDTIAKSIKQDQIFRFISFDIPETMRDRRNKFRSAIKKMGFLQIQQSLWVINRDVSELVEAAAYEYGVEKYITYIVSAKSDIDGIIAKKFSVQ